MNNLPSFRPRAAIGASAQNGSVNASPEFLRWLDQMRNSIESSSILPGTVSTSLSSGEPSGWKKLNGQALRKASYADLYAVIGDGFGSTATTFNLPDMSNRVLIGAGTIGLGNEGGEDSVTLTVSNLPAHSHGITDPGHTHSITDPGHAHGGVLQPGTAAGFTGSGMPTTRRVRTATQRELRWIAQQRVFLSKTRAAVMRLTLCLWPWVSRCWLRHDAAHYRR